MDKVTSWIKGHQVTAFFIITFAITWGLWFSYGAVMKQGQFLLAPLVFVATCGPALAGIIISAPFSPIMVGFTLVSVAPVAFVISMAWSRSRQHGLCVLPQPGLDGLRLDCGSCRAGDDPG